MRTIWRAALVAILVIGPLAGCEKDNREAPRSTAPAQSMVIIGTGPMDGLDYATAGAMAAIVNRQRPVYRLRCAVEPSESPIDRIHAVVAGDLQLAIVTADLQFQAVMGQAEWQAAGPQAALRSCFGLYDAVVTLVAAVDAGIRGIEDLRGRHVGIGGRGSDHRRHAAVALEGAGLNPSLDILADGAAVAAVPGLLQEGRIDAFFLTVAHPHQLIREATSGRRQVRIAALENIDTVVAQHPYYTPAKIPVKHYPALENTTDVPAFGVKATVVTDARVSQDLIYTLVKEIFENLEVLKPMHPAYADLTREGMRQGLTAELHPGAVRYFREAGLMD